MLWWFSHSNDFNASSQKFQFLNKQELLSSFMKEFLNALGAKNFYCYKAEHLLTAYGHKMNLRFF